MNQNKQTTPLIGICISKDKREFQRLVEERLERYPGNAALVKFHIEDLDFENLHVKGNCLKKKAGKMIQKQGVFPLPEVIYMQCHVDDEVVKKIEQLIGRKVFNNFIFDKWQCWDLLAGDKGLGNHLPNTMKLESETDLQQLLYNYQDVFLKPLDPTHGHSGRGIFRLKLQTDEAAIEAIYLKKHEMQRQKFRSSQSFWDWFSRKFSTRNYIIQQSIQTVKWGQMATDIRLHMNKNHHGEWQVSTLLFRVASNDSHIANDLKSILGIHFLKRMFSKLKVKPNDHDIERSIIDLGFKICRAFDESRYHLADLGIDIGLDENGHPWILEVNPLPFPYSRQNQYEAFTRPIEYAIYLLSK